MKVCLLCLFINENIFYFSVKFVGVFIIVYVGLKTLQELWTIFGDLNNNMVRI